MVLYVLDAAAQEDVRATVVVVGHGATWVEKSLTERARADVRLTFVEQSEQLGTGHAVSVALPTISDELGASDGDVLILPGDTPLLRPSTVARLLDVHRESQAALTVLTAEVDDPSGYGRIVHDKNGTVARIVEERDATADERLITEINTYYLTDLVAVLHEVGHVTQALLLEDSVEASGVNDLVQLANAEAVMRGRINEKWLHRGVVMWSPQNTYIDADVELAHEVSLLPGTVLKGHCVIERGARIGPNAVLSDVFVGEFAHVASVEATNARIGAEARVASFVVLSPGTVIASGEVVTPFSSRPQ